MASEAPALPRSRSTSPNRTPAAGEEQKEKRFLNGWTDEQERLMAEWSDLAMCYRWLHDKSEKFYHDRNLRITLPVIILTTLGGTANFGIQSLFSSDSAKQTASFAIGGISLIAGLMTTIGNYLRYAQSEEANRVASIAWGKFQRLIAVELALKPDDRMDSLDFLKICRSDLDRLIEQSPPIPEMVIMLFKKDFDTIPNLKKPDVCGALEHTRVFESSDTRLKQIAAEAALMLQHKKKTLSEFLTPQVQRTIKEQVDSQLHEALEKRRQALEDEIEQKKEDARRAEEEFHRALEERQRKIQEEIDAEKRKLSMVMNSISVEPTAATLPSPSPFMKGRASAFENRMQFKQNPLFSARVPSTSKILSPLTMTPSSSATILPSMPHTVPQNTDSISDNMINVVVIPSAVEQNKSG